MAQATATKVGEPAPALELPDTEGTVHTLPTPGEAPATVVIWTCNHCPYALAWHDRLVAGRARLRARAGSASSPSTPTTPSAIPRDSLEAMRERVRAEDWPFPYLHDESQQAARDWAAQVTPHVYVLDGDLRVRYEGAPDADHMDPGQNAAWLREALDDLLSGREASRGRDRARRVLDQVEVTGATAQPMTVRRRLVRVPASSANLGPGYDVLAAALSLHLELEVTEAGEFSVDAGGQPVPGRPRQPVRARLRGASSGRRPAVRDPQRDPARPRPRLVGGGDRRRADGRRPPVRAGARARADLRPRGRARGPPRQRRRGALRRLRRLPAAVDGDARPPPGPARPPAGRRGRAS